ncbi:NUDIX hydrolase [Chloroflexota bacterium]
MRNAPTTGITEKWIRSQLDRKFLDDRLGAGKTPDSSRDSSSNDTLKCAAVLIPLIYQESEWAVVFTRRTEQVDSHKGQVSFPGGACDPQEMKAEDTALREAWEEIGVKREEVNILGKLNDIVTITDFRVTPVIGIIPWPYQFTLSLQEVSRVFKIPLGWLAQPSNWKEEKLKLDGSDKEYSLIRYHPFDGEILWGATARITHNFLEVLDLI